MTDVVKTAAAKEIQDESVAKKKVNRRGVANARGTSRLKFTHELAKPNGLFIGHLDSITVNTIKIKEDTIGMPSFNGLEIPKLTIVFASNEEDANKRHYITLSFNAVESNVNTIPGGNEEWKVNSVFDWLKHILNVYVFKGRDLTDEESEALSLNFEDFDEQGEYVPVEPETVIAGWKVLFENFENIINRSNNGQPVYKDKNGKNIPIWMKLIRYVKSNKKGWQPINNGDLAFPAFVGEGCIELFKANQLPSIRLDSIKETILPMNVEKNKTPNMSIPAIGGVNVANVGATMPTAEIPQFNNINTEALEDMPF